MSLNLNDLLKKAHDKGITPKTTLPSSKVLRPWQEESTLYISNDEPKSNSGQTEDKVETNLSLTTVKYETNLSQNRDIVNSTTDKLETDLSQTTVKHKTNLSHNKDTFNSATAKLETDLRQITDKLETNLSRNRGLNNSPTIKPETNARQTKDKYKTNLGHTEVKPKSNIGQNGVNLSQTRDLLEPKPKSKSETILSQSRDRVESRFDTEIELNREFYLLSGLQKSLAIFIYDECQAVLAEETSGLTIDYIATNCNANKASIRKGLQRLENKKIIIRSEFRNGRGGWTRYKLPHAIYQEIHNLKSLNKLETNLSQVSVRRVIKLETNMGQLESEPKSEVETSDSRRRSFNILDSSSLVDEWNFDISDYEKFGFTKTKLKQLMSVNKLSAEEIRQSLVEFEHDVSHRTLPKNIKTNPINYLMGGLIKGSPYTSDNYQLEMNKIADEMRARYEQRQVAQQKNLILTWYESLTESDKKIMEVGMPTHLQIRYRVDGIFEKEVFSWIREYYTKKI